MSAAGGSQYKVDGLTHYQRNAAKYKQRTVERRDSIREYMRNRKAEAGCVDCGIKDFRVLDFDHVGPKTIEPTKMIEYGWSISRIETELAHCVVRCANCHRIVTFERGLLGLANMV